MQQIVGSLNILLLVSLLLAAWGCESEKEDAATEPQEKADLVASENPSQKDDLQQNEPAKDKVSRVDKEEKSMKKGHHGHHPPVDCPLHGKGVEAKNLEPFEETEKYIAFLEREERAQWQQPDKVVENLALRGDERLADLGAGSGYFSFRFAAALPQGYVVAADVDPEMVRHIHHKTMTEGISNLEAKLTPPDDPQLQGEFDLIFVCDVLHHVQNQKEWLDKVAQSLSSNGRLVIIDFKEGELPLGPPKEMKFKRAELIELVEASGFKLKKEHNFLAYQVFLEFERQ